MMMMMTNETITNTMVKESSGEGNVQPTELDLKKKLYDEFCQRKQESLRMLKRQLLETANHVERCSKRLHAMTASTSTTTATPSQG
jgi:HPt (histidine-containing phosphotransfer) domain-containing protein